MRYKSGTNLILSINDDRPGFGFVSFGNYRTNRGTSLGRTKFVLGSTLLKQKIMSVYFYRSKSRIIKAYKKDVWALGMEGTIQLTSTIMKLVILFSHCKAESNIAALLRLKEFSSPLKTGYIPLFMRSKISQPIKRWSIKKKLKPKLASWGLIQ